MADDTPENSDRRANSMRRPEPCPCTSALKSEHSGDFFVARSTNRLRIITEVVMLEGSNLLQALRSQDVALLEPMITECQLKAGHTMYEPGDRIDYCYFPRGSAIGSFFVMLE